MVNKNIDSEEEIFKKEMGKRIKKRREELQIPIRILATQLGYKHPSSLISIEKGEIFFPIFKVQKLLKILDTNLEYLFYGYSKKELGERLRERREELKITINSMSVDLNIEPTTLRNFEKQIDETNIPYSKLLKVCNYLGLSVDSITNKDQNYFYTKECIVKQNKKQNELIKRLKRSILNEQLRLGSIITLIDKRVNDLSDISDKFMKDLSNAEEQEKSYKVEDI